MKIVFNSSPVIFLANLGFIDKFIDSSDNFYLPAFVSNEISAKPDPASQQVKDLIDTHKIAVRTSHLTSLVNSLNSRLGRGESEAIALSLELQADYILLDDFAARKEALRLGLNVKGTLAAIRKLRSDGRIIIDDLEKLYEDLMAINFRVKRSLFDEVFKD